MSTITFDALINDIHYDPKKGTLKIQLIAANYVSLDKLAILGPQNENVHVTLESAQTRLADERDRIGLSEGKAVVLNAREEIKEKAERVEADDIAADETYKREFPIQEESEVAGETLTEFPIPKDPEGDGEAGEYDD
jgi:hypothetical protein